MLHWTIQKYNKYKVGNANFKKRGQCRNFSDLADPLQNDFSTAKNYWVNWHQEVQTGLSPPPPGPSFEKNQKPPVIRCTKYRYKQKNRHGNIDTNTKKIKNTNNVTQYSDKNTFEITNTS